MSRRAGAATAAAVLAAIGALAGCGASAPSLQQLRSAAARTCQTAGRRLDAIPTPTTPGGELGFLRRGETALRAQLAALDTLQPPQQQAATYTEALAATRRELAHVSTTVKALTAGADPVAAIHTLQDELAPLERRAHRAWTALRIPACAGS